MADEIIGIGILQPTWVGGVYRLWLDCRRSDGVIAQTWIFIKDKAAVGVPDKFPEYPDEVNSIWKFTRVGQRLNCEPSLNYISFNFHNAGQWSIPYFEMNVADRAESKAGPEPPRIERGSAIHYDINRCSPTPEDKAILISELRTEGALK
jgi:hypothetical protein